MTAFDAIIIGGGHNGLTCATLLAKSGRKVLVLEASDRVGGAARTEEFAPGFRVSSVAHILNRLHPDVVKALDLTRHGLDAPPPLTPPHKGEGNLGGSFPSPLWGGVRGGGSHAQSGSGPAPTVVLSPAGPVILRGGWGETVDGVTASEQAAWRAMRAQLLRYAGILKPFLTRRPPDLEGGKLSEKAALGLAGLSLRRLGREDMRDFLRMMLMNVYDVLDEHLSDDRLKGLAAFDAVLGSALGPRSPTSLLGLYYRLTGEASGVAGGQSVPAGGMGAVAAAFARAAEAAGVTIRTAAPVARILVERGRAAGVELASGETINAPIIVSAANPATTFLDLVGPRHLDAGFARRVRAIRMKGNVAKLHLALDRLPDFVGVAPADLRGRLVIARSADHVETAFNPSKYGEVTGDPVLELVIPSLADPSLAPAGAAVLSAVVPFAPYELRDSWDNARPRLLSNLIAALARHAPGVEASVRHAELLAPPDIERRFRMPGGHWHHGELQVDQMLVNRPLHGAAGYDTPIDGLFLGGAGSHPGGGVSGVPGMNAAKRVMERGK